MLLQENATFIIQILMQPNQKKKSRKKIKKKKKFLFDFSLLNSLNVDSCSNVLLGIFVSPSRMSTFPLDFFSYFNLLAAAIVTSISSPARDNSVAVHFLFLDQKYQPTNTD